MYVFDSHVLILCNSIVSPSIHEDLQASCKPLGLKIRSIYGGEETIHLLRMTYRQDIMTNSG